MTIQKRLFVKLYLAQRHEPLIFEVQERDFRHLAAVLDEPTSALQRFAIFDTTAPAVVSVSLSDVQAAHFLWEGGTYDDEPRQEEGEPIEVYLRGHQEPLFIDADADPESTEELNGVLGSIELARTDDDYQIFESFVDVDGERLYLRLDQLVCLVIPGEYLQVHDSETSAESET